MNRNNRRFLSLLDALLDALLLVAAYFFASWLWLDVVVHLENMAQAPWVPFAFSAATVLLLALCGCYDVPRGLGTPAGELARLWGVSLAAVGGAAALLYMLWLVDFSRGVLAVFYVTGGLALSLRRVVWARVRKIRRRRGIGLRRALVYGGGPLAERYIGAVAADSGVRVTERVTNLPALRQAMMGDVDEVVVALEAGEAAQAAEIIRVCEKNGTKVSIIPSFNDLIPASVAITCVGELKLMNLRANPLDNIGLAMVKRGGDIVLSAALLALLSPLLLVMALLVRLTSPGPVIFRQTRVGRNKKPFTMYKFRSMYQNDAEAAAWSTPNDPRKTPLGAWMRRYSIDELPQLFNVLRGDMSLVGPRPEIPRFVEQFRDSVPLYMVKHQVRPGMTGWAQVNGWRGNTSIVRRIEHDVWYIEHWSLRLDIEILLKTLLGGFINREAKHGAPGKEAPEREKHEV